MSDEGAAGCIAGVIVLALIVGLALAIDYVFMVAWNYVMPGFGLPEISFWQAVALTFVVGMLTRGLRFSSKEE